MKAKNKIVHKKDRPSFDKIDSLRKSNEGHWVTINGQHRYVANQPKSKKKK